MTSVVMNHFAAWKEWRLRETRVRVFGALLLASVGLDFSTYVAGTFHLYVHDLVAALVACYGIALALENRSVLPVGRLSLVPMALLAFLLANSVVLGAAYYANVPPDMQKLFWFEHGNALRIVGELLVWVWALNQLSPDKNESALILDFALWGCAVNVAFLGAYGAITKTTHAGTTAFDLDVMVGLPLAMVFVMTRGMRADLFRLVLFSAGSLFLYSRTAIVAVLLMTVAVLITSRQPRGVARSLGCLGLGWILAFGVPQAASAIAASLRTPTATSSQPPTTVTTPTAVDRTASVVSSDLAPYTIPSRLAIWSDALRMSAISPIVGVGYHDYFLYSRVTEIKDLSSDDLPGLYSSLIKQAHNDYLSWLVESGIIGLTIYMSFLAISIWHAWRLWIGSPDARPWHVFSLALITSLAAVSTFGEVLIPRTPEWVASATVWWIVIGLVFSAAANREGSSGRVNR